MWIPATIIACVLVGVFIKDGIDLIKPPEKEPSSLPNDHLTEEERHEWEQWKKENDHLDVNL